MTLIATANNEQLQAQTTQINLHRGREQAQPGSMPPRLQYALRKFLGNMLDQADYERAHTANDRGSK